MQQILTFSGGKDSTALALRMAETGEAFELLFNPTGDELPEMIDHIARIAALTGKRLNVTNPGYSLESRIRHYESLPNQNMRWCTRELKLEPTKAWLLGKGDVVLCVGLRADEQDREGAPGFYGSLAKYRLPFVEWGWGEAEVWGYLKQRGVEVPERTDCALCYDQRLGEWWKLWKHYPEKYVRGEELEALTGHTFRSDTRDTWPASLKGLREEFEKGRVPREITLLPLLGAEAYDLKVQKRKRCRVCSM